MARKRAARAKVTPPTAEIVAAGDSALLVGLGGADSPASTATTARVHALLAALDAHPPPGLRDLIPAYTSLLVQLDPLSTTHEAAIHEAAIQAIQVAIEKALGQSARAAEGDAPARLVEIPVTYGGAAGPDLEEVARLLKLALAEVVRRHAAADYEVAFLGFLAGFPYLSGLPSELVVPRLATPRTLVPAGSVAIAGEQAGIYPVDSPGGWRVIGHTALRLFDPANDPPALLRPGDRVRFVPTSNDAADVRELSLAAATANATTAHGVESGGAPWLRVLRPGPLTTVQDLGRWGYARYGVSASGAADPDALRLGNLLLGNPPAAAALEITLGGASFAILAPCAVALTGADCAAHVDDAPLSPGIVAELRAGQTLTLDIARAGLRAYLCVAGGVAVAPLLGSRATDLRAGFGGLAGRALRVGDELRRGELASGPPARWIAGRRLPPDPSRRAPADGVQRLRVLPGPHAQASPAALPALLEGEYVVDPRSDRMGVRLQRYAAPNDARDGPAHLPPQPPGGQIVSVGVPRGAIQIPPDGAPILLLAEHQTTGGYLIPAVVTAADHWRVGQLRPGERVRFELASAEEAIAALRERATYYEQVAHAGGLGLPACSAVDVELLARGFSEWDEATDATMGGARDRDRGGER